jgi:hypothetical protein
MKRLFLGLFAMFLFVALGPVPSANAWWWHHHSSPDPAGVGANKKYKAPKAHREHHHKEKPAHLYSKPRSFGWWHHDTPGPMGAGSGEK